MDTRIRHSKISVPTLALAAAVSLVCTQARAGTGNEPKPWRYNLPSPSRTVSEVEPNDNCAFNAQPLECGTKVHLARLSSHEDADYFAVTAHAGDLLTVATSDDYFGGGGDHGHSVDTVLEILSSDCQTVLASDDDGGPDRLSFLPKFEVPEDGTYFVRVTGFEGDRGDYDLLAFCGEAPLGPGADLCSPERLLPSCSAASSAGTMEDANNNYDPGPSSFVPAGAAGRDLAYGVLLGAGDHLSVAYTAAEDGVIYLLRDCENPSASCVAGADAYGGGHVETLDYIAPSGGVYFLIFDSYGNDTGTTWTASYSIDCAPVTGACCLPSGQCQVLAPTACEGTYIGDRTSCDPNPCGADPARGACCLYDSICVQVTEDECVLLSGDFRGDGTICDVNTCTPPVRTQATSWGLLKTRYR